MKGRFIMMIQNNTISHTIQAKSVFHAIGTTDNLEKNNSQNSQAAVFKQSTLEDYDANTLNPIQKGILNIQKQIESLQNNKDIDKTTKDDLLKQLNSQLEEMQKELTSSQQLNATDDKDDKKGNTLNPSSSTDDNMSFIISAGTNLQGLKEASAFENKVNSKANLQESQLEHDVNHPQEALRLTDKEIIAKRTEEISNLQESTDRLHNLYHKISDEQNSSDSTSLADKLANKEDAETKQTIVADEESEDVQQNIKDDETQQ